MTNAQRRIRDSSVDGNTVLIQSISSLKQFEDSQSCFFNS